MSWFTGLVTLVKAIPDLMKLFKEVMKYIHEAADYIERWKRTKDIQSALKTARETKDTTELNKLFNGGKSDSPADS